MVWAKDVDPASFELWTVNEYVPGTEGIPEISPVDELIVTPFGTEPDSEYSAAGYASTSTSSLNSVSSVTVANTSLSVHTGIL